LASDPDREGEAIAWHLNQIIRKSEYQKIRRVEFHEITEEAIKDAFKHPRQINMQLVDAQQARRVLDRLVGYKLSPLLWKRLKEGFLAGRVQTVTLRLIVEREREIEAFLKNVEYWSLEAELSAARSPATPRDDSFFAQLVEWNGKRLAVWDKRSRKRMFSILNQSRSRSAI